MLLSIHGGSASKIIVLINLLWLFRRVGHPHIDSLFINAVNDVDHNKRAY